MVSHDNTEFEVYCNPRNDGVNTFYVNMINTSDTLLCFMSHLVGKPTMWFPNRSDTNRAVQLQKQARILKFRS